MSSHKLFQELKRLLSTFTHIKVDIQMLGNDEILVEIDYRDPQAVQQVHTAITEFVSKDNNVDPLAIPGGNVVTDLLDDDIMWFGKHQGVRLVDIPADYFHWLYQQPNYGPKADNPLARYIRRNIAAFKMEYPDLIW